MGAEIYEKIQQYPALFRNISESHMDLYKIVTGGFKRVIWVKGFLLYQDPFIK